MAFGFKRTIQPKGSDRFVINLDADERAVVKAVCEDVLGVLDDGDANPFLRRLFPVAHVDDEEINAQYRDLVRSDLLRTRREILERVAATAHDTELDRTTLDVWMVGLNTVRLVLGTRLDVTEESSPDLDPDDPDVPAWMLYEFLGSLVSLIIDALSRTS
jgi:hypothetical protein